MIERFDIDRQRLRPPEKDLVIGIAVAFYKMPLVYKKTYMIEFEN